MAVLRGQQVLQQTILEPSLRTAAALAPAVERLLQYCQQTNQTLGFVSVADGPGSFTGLRIGVTTAKTLSYALGLPLVGVDSIAAIAATVFGTASPADGELASLLVAIDAYRGQVFAGHFTRSGLMPPSDSIPDEWTPHPPSVEVLTQTQWNQRLAAQPPTMKRAGDVNVFTAAPVNYIARSCDAVGVGWLGLRAAVQQRWSDPLALVPRYLKASAAEEKAGQAS